MIFAKLFAILDYCEQIFIQIMFISWTIWHQIMRTLNFKLPCLRPIEHPCAMAVGIDLFPGHYCNNGSESELGLWDQGDRLVSYISWLIIYVMLSDKSR
jgi:hypothetical protein